jgi:hypothetical protein
MAAYVFVPTAKEDWTHFEAALQVAAVVATRISTEAIG